MGSRPARLDEGAAEAAEDTEHIAAPWSWQGAGLWSVIGACAAYGALVLYRAWLCEDAFICLRVAQNLVAGNGFVWNLGDRVMVVTNPLWTLLVSLGLAVTGEDILTTVAVGWLCSVLAVGVLAFRIAPTPKAAIPAVLGLCSTRFFLDYSTGGLENPLVHLLIIGFYGLYFLPSRAPRHLGWMTVLIGAGLMCRPDFGLLVGPAMLVALWEHRGWPAIRAIIAGGVPFVAWCTFATLYFGSPIPNTAWAKLNHLIADEVLWDNGWDYLSYTFLVDPAMLLMIALPAGLAIGHRLPRSAPVVLSMGAFLLYLASIGGGYMAGRFMTPLVAMGAVLMAVTPWRWPVWGATLAATAVTASLIPAWVMLGNDIWDPQHPWSQDRFVRNSRDQEVKNYHLLDDDPQPFRMRLDPHTLHERLDSPPVNVVVAANIGRRVYLQEEDAYVLNSLALSDPLLARLPAITTPWHPGHSKHVLPKGYLETLRTGENQLKDPKLAALYERLRRIHRGPIWDRQRLSDIAYIHFADMEDYVDDVSQWQEPGPEQLSLSEVLDADEPIIFGAGGLEILLPEMSHVAQWSVAVDPTLVHRIIFYRDDRGRGTDVLRPERRPPPGLATRTITAPEKAVRGGYNRLEISCPPRSEQQCELDALRPLPEAE